MIDYSDVRPERGEFVGDGIARTAGNIPYNPESDGNASFPDDEFWNSRESLRQIRDYAVSRFVSPYALLSGCSAASSWRRLPMWCCRPSSARIADR